jgi:hypothetical protein
MHPKTTAKIIKSRLIVEKIIPSKIAHFEPKNAHSSINLKLNRAISQNQRPMGNIVPWISRSQMT